MLQFDHLKLISRDAQEVRRFCDLLSAMQAGKLEEFFVLHERDDSCCRREPWNETLLALHGMANPPIRLAVVNLPPGV